MKTKLSRKRHILKTITWRIVGTFDTILIGWFVSGDVTIGFSIGSIELFSKMVLYYFHERAWDHIKWGLN